MASDAANVSNTPAGNIAAGSTVFLSFINTYAAAIGVIVGGITLIMNWWFKWQHLKLAKEKKSKEELEKLNGYIE